VSAVQSLVAALDKISSEQMQATIRELRIKNEAGTARIKELEEQVASLTSRNRWLKGELENKLGGR
jgi:predicted RNase H-like nuclease (RuvC/YqgF family)